MTGALSHVRAFALSSTPYKLILILLTGVGQGVPCSRDLVQSDQPPRMGLDVRFTLSLAPRSRHLTRSLLLSARRSSLPGSTDRIPVGRINELSISRRRRSRPSRPRRGITVRPCCAVLTPLLTAADVLSPC